MMKSFQKDQSSTINNVRTTFEALQDQISKLTSSDSITNDDPTQKIPKVQLINSENEMNYMETSSFIMEIKTLIFWPSNNDSLQSKGTFAVAILPSSKKVDVAKLSHIIATVDSKEDETIQKFKNPTMWELAPSHLVQALCGFQPEKGGDLQLLGGGGKLQYRSLTELNFLLQITNAAVADITTLQSQRQDKFDGSMAINGQDTPKQEQDVYNLHPKPFFPVAPPATIPTENKSQPPNYKDHQPVPVTTIGRITSVRQIAKKLVFADLAPPDYPLSDENCYHSYKSSDKKETDFEKDMPWRSGEDGKD
eukprot:12689243-Ditylum_brightwellii.AAC.1